jgi:hypothetical protein
MSTLRAIRKLAAACETIRAHSEDSAIAQPLLHHLNFVAVGTRRQQVAAIPPREYSGVFSFSEQTLRDP